MSEKEVQGYVEAAEKAHAEKKREATEKIVKQIVQEALEKIERLERQIDNLQEEKKQLKMTIDDLKSGNLKLLKERLEKDKKAREAINIKVIEVVPAIWVETPRNPWIKPFEVWYGHDHCVINGTDAKWNTLGTYQMTSGNAVTLR